MNAHPLDKKLQTFPPDSDDVNGWRNLGERQKQDVSDSFAVVAALTPEAEGIEEAITRADTALRAVTVSLGPVRGWTIARQRELYDQAQRLLGAQQRLVPPPRTSEF